MGVLKLCFLDPGGRVLFHSSKTAPFFVLLVVIFAGNVFAECPNGDLDNDCYVGITDLAIFAAQWLDPAGCVGHPDDCGDLLGNDGVNMLDFTAIASNWMASKPHLSINEFMASNNTTLADGEGGYDDWIEIYNDSDGPLDVGGMYLTDDLGAPSKWMIPTGNPGLTTIASKGYLLIWADNEAGSGLHAPFKLGAGGEEIGLYDTDANGRGLIDSVTFGGQETDISYGRYPDGTNDLRFFGTATPLMANSGAYIGEVEDTSFNYNRGFYSSPINVTIGCDTPGATIYYTLDGSDPTLSSTVYAGAIPVISTTCLRARAYKAGWLETDIDTQTYLFISDIVTQSQNGERPSSNWPNPTGPGGLDDLHLDYGMDPDVVNDPSYSSLIDDALLAIPTFSLVTDIDNLFDASTGIYTNPQQDGVAWERPVSVELLNPDGSEGFQINAGFRIRGGWSRHKSNPKHAFRLFFRSEYGDSKLEYPLFEDEGVDEFEKVDLRTAQNYSWSFGCDAQNTMIREVFSRDTQRDMEQPYTRSRYYHLYINGHYWGIYQTQERAEARFAKSYFGGEVEDYDVVKAAWSNIDATDGNDVEYNNFWALANSGFSSGSAYNRARGLNPDGTVNPTYPKYLDVDNLIDYMLCVFYAGDFDGPVSWFGGNNYINNFYAVYNRNNPDGWKFFRHDGEHTLLAHVPGYEQNIDRTGPYPAGSSVNMFNPQWLNQQLLANTEYKIRFADRTHKHFANNGVLTPGEVDARLLERKLQVETAIIAESARWGDAKCASWPKTKNNDWTPAVDGIFNNFTPTRTSVILAQLRSQGWYPSIDPPVFYVNGSYKHGGYITAGDNLTMTHPNGSGALYYTLDGTDPRVSAADSGTSTELTLVTEAASKKVWVPTGPAIGGTGSISVEYWLGITGTSVSDLTNNGNYPNNPSSSGSLSSFEIPIDSADNYGTRVRGYLHPPSSGNYKFWIASDDSSQLWLSSDEDPANVSQIAYVNEWTWSREWGKYASQVSSNISLTAGQTYYIEALHKEGTGGDNLAVAWEGPGFSQKVIEGADLSPIGESWMLINFDDTSWTSGTGGIGYENSQGDPVNYTALIDTDVKSAMYNVNPTCYIRIPFTISDEDLGALTNLSLNIRYDDGFIAYINGVKVAEDYADSTPGWDSIASGLRDDSLCDDVTEIDISSFISSLFAGNNVLSIHGMNVSTGSSDFLITAELKATKSEAGSVAPTAIEYTGGNITLNESTRVKARVLDEGQWSALNDASYGIGPVAENLRITEIMYHPANDPNSEFIELENIGGSPINLKLASFTDGIDFTFGNQILAGGDHVVVVRNLAAFNTAHSGFAGTVAGIYNGSLDNSGELVKLEDAVGTAILDFRYQDGWYDITDGSGFSLTLLDSSNADLDSWSDKDSWTSSTVLGGTPGQADTGPKPGDIVINEVLAHSDTVAYDWIELYNTTSVPIDIGGWFLSDSSSDDPNLMKYEIGAGETIGGYGYKVFYENLHFGSVSSDPGRHIPFALSENGETVYLSSASGGVLSGYREKEDFGASETDVSFGRYAKSPASGYDVDFVAMNSRTNGSANSSPKVGPVVISEIMYHPSGPDSDAEYIELVNISGSPVTLYDAATNEPWKFVDDYKSATPGIEYYFPTAVPVTLAAGERILLVKDVAAFNAKFSAPGVQIFAWSSGSISNSGERLQLSLPGDIDGEGVRQYIRVDRVNFGDGSHPEEYPDLPGDPWPTGPDGLGDSLDRISDTAYGNDVANWQAGTPSPGG